MSKEVTEIAEEAANKPQGPDQATQETIFEEKKEEGTDIQAQDVIKGFLRDRLFEFHDEVETALDQFEAYVANQQEDFKAAFSQQGFFSYIGEQFEKSLFDIPGGAGAQPLMTGLVGEVHNAVSFAEHSCGSDLSLFINNAFRRGTRDACWYVRDAAEYLMGDKWNEVVSLAADGSDQFIPALYQFGLPSRAFKPMDFGQSLIDQAEAYRQGMGLKRDEVKEEQPENPKQDEIDQQAQKDMIQEADKPKDAVAL